MKVENHKYIESYFVQELPNGVITLTINCTQKEIYFHDYNHYEFLIVGTEKEYDESVYGEEGLFFKTPEFLSFEKGVTFYLRTSTKEKDQIQFVYTPYKKEWVKNKMIKTIIL